jgi:hypothetical protein
MYAARILFAFRAMLWELKFHAQIENFTLANLCLGYEGFMGGMLAEGLRHVFIGDCSPMMDIPA